MRAAMRHRLLGGIASAIVLRHLELDVHLPEHVFAGRPMLARLLLQNLSGWLPSFSIRVVPSKRKPVKRWHWEAYTLGLPRNRPPESQWFRVPDRRLRRVVENPDKPILKQTVYFPFLAAGQDLRADLEMNFPVRGRYRHDGFRGDEEVVAVLEGHIEHPLRGNVPGRSESHRHALAKAAPASQRCRDPDRIGRGFSRSRPDRAAVVRRPVT